MLLSVGIELKVRLSWGVVDQLSTPLLFNVLTLDASVFNTLTLDVNRFDITINANILSTHFIGKHCELTCPNKSCTDK